MHSKILIADDRLAIIGSANLNNRSQYGDRDSEIAVLVTGGDRIRTMMAGKPWTATLFAHTLRRNLMEEHLGLAHTCQWYAPDAVGPESARGADVLSGACSGCGAAGSGAGAGMGAGAGIGRARTTRTFSGCVSIPMSRTRLDNAHLVADAKRRALVPAPAAAERAKVQLTPSQQFAGVDARVPQMLTKRFVHEPLIKPMPGSSWPSSAISSSDSFGSMSGVPAASRGTMLTAVDAAGGAGAGSSTAAPADSSSPRTRSPHEAGLWGRALQPMWSLSGFGASDDAKASASASGSAGSAASGAGVPSATGPAADAASGGALDSTASGRPSLLIDGGSDAAKSQQLAQGSAAARPWLLQPTALLSDMAPTATLGSAITVGDPPASVATAASAGALSVVAAALDQPFGGSGGRLLSPWDGIDAEAAPLQEVLYRARAASSRILDAVTGIATAAGNGECACVCEALRDPADPRLTRDVWRAAARHNTAVYDRVFPGIMKASTKTMAQWQQRDAEPPRDEALLEHLVGHLVAWPADFLSEEDLGPKRTEAIGYAPQRIMQ